VNYCSKRGLLVPKDYCAFVINELQVILSTVNDFCKAAPDFSTVEDWPNASLQ
jgi:uncharacterized protein YchJ